ncbi:dethiobiotin synthase [Shewanella yunxiaonensis]|uniref:ATP-dependent dethiobiotin synthetase BioD n=1 Tax=Shewanella yunxiaonensis TaxID=2829809 RepID=A0ABX7YYM6_9GAMM|nr:MULTISPECIES: dethiobiotin synthase [Shewanella]MDF0534308.1 dethiobiotin synthase [Shewanella sp. A32]QUN07553.1 dethiobiotin synthase [Shewanella yunxiaonensis]
MFFVTGTDTDSGKTHVAAAMLHKARTSYRMKTVGVKPIASGCERTADGLRNADARMLIAESTLKLDYNKINPFTFEPAIAPHIAAADIGVDLSPEEVFAQLDLTQYAMADFCLVEGAGGWRLPLGDNRYLSETVVALAMPVIIVVGMKLGCLNHAVMTEELVRADGLQVAGWVANRAQADMARFEENLASLKQMMQSPCLGVIPHLTEPSVEDMASYLDLTPLMQQR